MAGDTDTRFDERINQVSRIGLPVAVLIGAVIAGLTLGAPGTVLVLAGGALIGVIATFWSSVRTLLGETPLTGADAYALGAPRAEEEQKRAVLRALADLKFERSVGKISEEDYQELEAKYRAEGKRLLRLLDEEAGPRRAQVEALVAKRLRREGLLEEDDEKPAAEAPAVPEEKPKGKLTKKKKRPRAAEARGDGAEEAVPLVKSDEPTAPTVGVAHGRGCAKCGTTNDVDAIFCKKCGEKQVQGETIMKEPGEP